MHPTQPDSGEFARLLAGIMEQAGLSYQAVASAAGLNRSQVWRWVHSGSAPGYEPVRRLAAYLIAEHPQVAADAAALLPAAGYEAPPVHDVPAAPEIRLPGQVPAGLEAAAAAHLPAIRDRLARLREARFAELTAQGYAPSEAAGLLDAYRPAGLDMFPAGGDDAGDWDDLMARGYTPAEAGGAIATLRAMDEQRARRDPGNRDTGLAAPGRRPRGPPPLVAVR